MYICESCGKEIDTDNEKYYMDDEGVCVCSSCMGDTKKAAV